MSQRGDTVGGGVAGTIELQVVGGVSWECAVGISWERFGLGLSD